MIVTIIAVLLPGAMLAPVWGFGGLGADEDDVLYYLPSRVHFAETVRAGEPPWLNPWTGLDRPFLADPQTAAFYPLTWLFAVVPWESAYPAALWAHYSLALLGMYRLLRGCRLRLPAVVLGMIAFAFCGFLLAHRTHLAMQNAAAWAPWVFWSIERFARRGGSRRLAVAALCCALQCFAGHLQIAALTALGSLVLLAGPRAGAAIRIRRWLLTWLAAGGLFGAQLVPTLLYLMDCTRTSQSYLQFTENSWNPLSIVSLALPMFFGQRVPNWFDTAYWGPSHQVEQFAYPGVLVLLLALVACRRHADTTVRNWRRLLVFSALLALGVFGPICPLLYWIPGASVFRVPARAMLLCNLSLAVLAAYAVHHMTGRLRPEFARARAAALRITSRPIVVVSIVVLVPMLAAALAWPLAPAEVRNGIQSTLRIWRPTIVIPALLWVTTLLALRWFAVGWRAPRRVWMLVGVLAIDLGMIGWSVDVPRSHPGIAGLLATEARPEYLKYVTPGSGRLWVITRRADGTPGEYNHPRERGVANANILYGVRALTDYGPLQPREYVAQFGFRPWGECENPRPLLADTELLRDCNVGWILLCDDLLPVPTSGELVWSRGSMRLFRTENPRGEAFLRDADIPQSIRVEHDTPHHFTTIVDFWTPDGNIRAATATLIVSRLALPGWTATMDGKRIPIHAERDLLLACEIPVGETVVIEWRYAPPGLKWGVLLTTLSGIALLAAAATGKRVAR